MKVARFFAVIFAVAGIVLMLGTSVICFASVNSSVKILEYPEGAAACSEQLLSAVQAGDYTAMEQLLYGQPALGAEGTPDNAYAALIWDAFRENISFEYSGNLYLLDADLARDALISVPDVSAVIGKLNTMVPSLLAQKAAAAEDAATLYDENGNYSADITEQALREALEQVLREDIPYVTQSVTIKLIRRDGRWWVVPDQAFLNAISGLQA